MWCTTLHQGQFHRFLFFCFVLSCYVLWCDVPPFIKVNTIDSYSFVMYCYVMYCDVIYHPSSRSIPPLLILLLCLVMLCIVRSRTTLHHSQFHQVKVIRNSEVLLPNFLWLVVMIEIWTSVMGFDPSPELPDTIFLCYESHGLDPAVTPLKWMVDGWDYNQ